MTTCISDRDWDHSDGLSLRKAQQVEMRLRYKDDPEPSPAPTSANITVFIVAYIDDQPVGCGGLRDLPKNGTYPGEAELKRMFVIPEKRGRGLGVASANSERSRKNVLAVEATSTRYALRSGCEERR
ncbi:hypothetical protein VTL71DRAFT_6505, partial [Oculimacula yallundae]